MTTWTTIIVSVLAMSAMSMVATTAKNEAQNPSEGLLIFPVRKTPVTSCGEIVKCDWISATTEARQNAQAAKLTPTS